MQQTRTARTMPPSRRYRVSDTQRNSVAGKREDECRDYRYASVPFRYLSPRYTQPIWREKDRALSALFRPGPVSVPHWMARSSCRSCFDSCCSDTSGTFIRKRFSAAGSLVNRFRFTSPRPSMPLRFVTWATCAASEIADKSPRIHGKYVLAVTVPSLPRTWD